MDPALALEVGVLSQQKTLNETTARGDSDVQRFYKNSVVFITGGSGFLGKQLIEKLLRSCTISKLYLLIRQKKGKLIQERVADILKDPVFDTLRRQQQNFAKKIVPIEGDVSEIGLGIKKKDWETLTEEVDVIFHVAAITKFDETLQSATLINVRGTREALKLGKACKKLKTYVHVSTAYSHATTQLIENEVKEEFYDPPILPETLISMAENMDPDRLINITKQLIKGWPNTYTFTKAVSEDLIRTTSIGLPICIVRPGIVMCTYREPGPGWVDFSCMYGACGIIFGLGMGLLHVIRVNPSVNLAIVPCDYVNNAIIVAGRETATNQSKGGKDTRIYAVTSTKRNPVTWGHLENTARTKAKYFPTPVALYYNYGLITSNFWLFMILTLFLHLIPAYIADFVCLLMGKQRRIVKITKKVYNINNVLSFFLINQWKFVDDNLNKLYKNLSKQDKVIYNFDIPNINWTEYMLILVIGIRKYIIKDGLKNTEYAVKKQRYLKIAHYIIMALYMYSIWKLCYLVVSLVNNFIKMSFTYLMFFFV